MLHHLAARIFGTPLLVHRAKLDVILSVLAERLSLARREPQLAPPLPMAPNHPAFPETSIAVIPIHGTLVKRTLGLEAASGLMSYAEIGMRLEAALRDPAVAGIVLDIDSPGGETGGCFELARRVREAAAVKPVWAVANDAAFSAAYAIAAATQRVIVTETGGVGSVGVIALHVDQSVKDAQEGYRYTAITAGARKNDFSPHEPLSDTAKSELQTEVDRLYALFVSHVAAMRGMSEETIRETEAALYFGPSAVEAGLADAVGTLETTLSELATVVTPKGRLRSPARARSLVGCARVKEKSSMQDESQDMIGADEAAGLAAEARKEVMQSAQAIAELCMIAGCPDKAAEYIAAGRTDAEVRHLLVEMKATSQAPEIVSTIDPSKAAATSYASSNPLIAAVKHLVGKE